ncbi:hypothetical protein ACLB2K_061338 [Fragaria x ananassa]
MVAMEITRTLLPSSSFSNLRRAPPLFHFHVSPSSSLYPDVLHSQSSLPITSRSHFRKPLAVSDGSASATKVAVDDPSLEVKKKAMDVSPELKGTTIFLVGMKSSIKTSLGKFLANVLRYYYFDSDSLVEEAAGTLSAAKSLREIDKSGFQESETEVLKQLSSMGRLMVCAGDGATQSTTNLALLRHGITIWIDVPLDIVARGMVEDQTQLSAYNLSTSVAYPEVLTRLSTAFEELRGGYAIADATVSVQQVAGKLGYDEIDDVTTEDMVLEVLKEVEKLTRVKKMMEEAARPF